MQQALDDFHTFVWGSWPASPGPAKQSSAPFLVSLSQFFQLPSTPQAAETAPASPLTETAAHPVPAMPLLANKSGSSTAPQRATHTPSFPRNLARRDAWCSLLGLDPVAISHGPDFRQHLSSDPQLLQHIDRDIHRVALLISHACNRNTRWSRLVAEITNVVLSKHGLPFYQGYMDIVSSVVLLLGDGEDERVAFAVVEQLTLRQLRSQTSSQDNRAVSPVARRVLDRIVGSFDHGSGGALVGVLRDDEAGVFCVLPALSYMDTWSQKGSADLGRLGVLMDLYLHSPPLMPLYVFAAVFLSRGHDLLQQLAHPPPGDQPRHVCTTFCKDLCRTPPTDEELARAQTMLRELPPRRLMEELLAEEGAGGRLEDHAIFSLWLPHSTEEGQEESSEQGVTPPPAVSLTTALQQPSVAPSGTTMEGMGQETSGSVVPASSSSCAGVVLEGRTASAVTGGHGPAHDDEAAEAIVADDGAVMGSSGWWRRLAGWWAGVADWLAMVAGRVASWWQ